MPKLALLFILSLWCAETLAVDCSVLNTDTIHGSLNKGEKRCYIIAEEAGGLSSWEVRSANRAVHINIQNTAGDEIGHAINGLYQDAWRNKRYVAPVNGNYKLIVSTTDQSAGEFDLSKRVALDDKGRKGQLEAFDHYLNQNAIPLVTDSDMASLASKLGGRSLIGIGEAAHGARDFWDLRARVVIGLAERQSLRTVLLEMPFHTGKLMNQYAQGKIASAESVFQDIRNPIARLEGMAAFLKQIRGYNENVSQENRIRIIGIDIHPGPNEDDLVAAFLGKVAPDMKGKAADLMSDSTMNEVWRRLSGDMVNTDGWAILAREGEELKSQFALNHDKWIAASSKEDWQDSYLAVSARTAAITVFSLPFKDAIPARDQFMKSGIMDALRETNRPVAFLAHDAHVSTAPDFFTGPTVGSLLRKDLGDRYLAIGTAYDEGSVLAMYRGDYRLGAGTFKFGPAMEASLPSYLRRGKLETYALMMNFSGEHSADGIAVLSEPLQTRMVPMDSSAAAIDLQYEAIVPKRDFDVLIFKRKIEADKAL